MVRWLAVVMIMMVSVAGHAEPALELHDHGERSGEPRSEPSSDPLWRPGFEPSDAVRDRSAIRRRLGDRAWLTFEGSWWSAERDGPGHTATRDRPGQG